MRYLLKRVAIDAERCRTKVIVLLCAVSTLLAAHAPRDGIWIWSGQSIRSEDFGRPLYLYQGDLGGPDGYVHRGLFPHRIAESPIVLTFRLRNLIDAAVVSATLSKTAAAWRAHGSAVRGFQIDFDAPSQKLAAYAQFLAAVRVGIPKSYFWGITGLGDWLASAPRIDLERIAACTDEIAFQVYQGRRSLWDRAYIDRLVRWEHPFRVGTLAGDEAARNPADGERLAKNPNYKGVIEFLPALESGRVRQ